MESVGLAKAKKSIPLLQLGESAVAATDQTLEALIAHRYQVMAHYAKGMQAACKNEIEILQTKGADLAVLKTAKRWLHRDAEQIPATALAHLDQARSEHPVLDKMVTMREELRQMWISTSTSKDHLVRDLQLWCQRAEASGIAALSGFSHKLKAVKV
jgi:stearoyl-CoA desaturase (delta-9 desaturase)